MVAPDGRQPRQPRGSEQDLQSGEGVFVDDACDAARLGLTVGRPAPVHDVEASVRAAGAPGDFEGTLDDFRRHIHPDDVAIVNAAHVRSIQHGEPYRAHFRTVWPDGSVHWLTAKGRVARNAAGEPTGIPGIAIDVTQRKELELRLNQAQKMESLGQWPKSSRPVKAADD